MLVPAITDGNEPGEPDARKPARPVRERVVGNVSTSRVRERRVSFQSLSPALLETRQRASYLFHGSQPGEDLLPLSFKGVFVGPPPAQDAFSPLLLSVQSVEHRC